MKKFPTSIKVIVSVTLIYTFLGFIVLPLILKDQIEKQLNRQLLVPTTIQSIYFNPFTFTLELNKLQTTLKNKPFVSFEMLQVNFSLLKSLHKRHFSFKHIELKQPKVFLYAYKDGSTNLSSLTQQLNAQPKEAKKQTKSQSTPTFKIIKTVLSDAQINLMIEKNGSITPLVLNELNYTFYDLGTFKNALASHKLNTLINDQTQLKVQGGFRIEPFHVYGNVSLQNLQTQDFSNLLSSFLNGSVREGTVDVSFGYNLELFPALKLSLNKGRLALKNIQVEQNKQSLLGFKSLNVHGINMSYPAQKISVKEILLSKPFVHAVQKDGHLNLSTLIKATPKNESSSKAPTPWEVHLQKVLLKQGGITYTNATKKQTLKVNNIQNTVNNLVFSKGQLNVQELNVMLEKTHYLQTKAVEVHSQNLALNLNDIQYSPLALTIKQILLKQPQSTLQNNQLKLNVKQINVNVKQFEKTAQRTQVKSIDVNNPVLSILLKKKSELPTSKKSEAKTKAPSNLNIGPFKINNATFAFEDKNLPIPFNSTITKLNGEFSQFISNSSAPTKLRMEGQVNAYGYTKITGFIDHENIQELTDVNMIFKNIAIEDLSAYSGKFVGRSLKEGKLNLDLKYNIKRANLEAQNDIIIQDIQLGRKIKSDTAMDLPLELAIALLEDSDGKIDLKIPISGDLKNPQFQIAPLVWKTLGNLIVKAVSAPFKFLASLLGIQEDEIKMVEFEFGKYALLPSEKETLDNLLQIIQKRPTLMLTLEPSYDKEKDTQALQVQKFEAYMHQAMKKTKAKDVYKKALAEYYETAYKLKTKPLKKKYAKEKYLAYLKTQLIKKQVITKVQLQTLAQQRVQSIQAYFKSKKSPTQNIVFAKTLKTTANKDAKWAQFDIKVSVKKP